MHLRSASLRFLCPEGAAWVLSLPTPDPIVVVSPLLVSGERTGFCTHFLAGCGVGCGARASASWCWRAPSLVVVMRSDLTVIVLTLPRWLHRLALPAAERRDSSPFLASSPAGTCVTSWLF